MPRKTVVLLAALLVVGGWATAGDNAATDSKQAFEKVKALAGVWQGTGGAEGEPAHPAEVRFAVTAGGNAVAETLFAGTAHEMLSVYTLEGEDLVVTHHCASGNHPKLKLDTAASRGDELVFGFAGATNFDAKTAMHIHGARYWLKGDQLEAEWLGYAGDKPDHTMKASLARQKG